jgi:2-isopropylmalate synthase
MTKIQPLMNESKMSEIIIPPQERVVIFDTTLRDGEQWAGGALTGYEKLKIAHQLAATRVDVIEAGFAASSRRDFDAIKAIASEVQGPAIASLARANEHDITRAAEALRDAQHPRIHTFIATSDEHMRDKLMKSPDAVLKIIDTMVRFAKNCVGERGSVEWSAEDASRSSLDFLAKAVRVAIDAGATTINLPDTVGYATPREYAHMFTHVIAAVKPAPDIVFSAHVHNDRGLAVANSLAAVEAGARQVECTIRGVGERAGNAALEPVVFNLTFGKDNPFTCAVDTRQLKPTADLHASFIPDVSVMQPIIGNNVFAHGSGIHQDGMVKGGCYEYANKEDYGHVKGNKFPLTVHSGVAGIGAGLERMGIRMTDPELKGFMDVFKENAAQLLNQNFLRVVPDERTEHWAKRYLEALKVG